MISFHVDNLQASYKLSESKMIKKELKKFKDIYNKLLDLENYNGNKNTKRNG